MSQFAGLDVKILFSGDVAKRVKMPMTFTELFTQIKNLAKAKGRDNATPIIQYADTETEWVVVEDDVDLEMAYTIAFNYMEKRIKFVVTDGQANSLSSTQAPSTAAMTENVEMQSQQD